MPYLLVTSQGRFRKVNPTIKIYYPHSIFIIFPINTKNSCQIFYKNFTVLAILISEYNETVLLIRQPEN
jgi:hypothetical protein